MSRPYHNAMRASGRISAEELQQCNSKTPPAWSSSSDKAYPFRLWSVDVKRARICNRRRLLLPLPCACRA